MNDHSETPPPDEVVEYVGSPTEYADAAEAPSWVQTLVKAIMFLPTALTALSVIELALFVLVALVVCVVAAAVFAL